MLAIRHDSASSPQRIKAFSRRRCDPGEVEATRPRLGEDARTTPPVARMTVIRLAGQPEVADVRPPTYS
jgi:hypothetical protein